MRFAYSLKNDRIVALIGNPVPPSDLVRRKLGNLSLSSARKSRIRRSRSEASAASNARMSWAGCEGGGGNERAKSLMRFSNGVRGCHMARARGCPTAEEGGFEGKSIIPK